MNNADYPVQFILMRSDMASMNAGKGMAQAAHASSVMAKFLENASGVMKQRYETWLATTQQGFGTCIVLDGGSEANINSIVDELVHADVYIDWVNDPTYPLVDGDVCHLIDINTCAVIFGMKSTISELLAVRGLSLHP